MIDLEKWKTALIYASNSVISNETYLCDLDRYVGDGDHGMTVARGFRGVKNYLDSTQETNLSQLTSSIGSILSKEMGGAIGPIFQSVFAGMASACTGLSEIDLPELSEMFCSALKRVKMIGGANEGDKTLIDSLSPACFALVEAKAEGLSIEQALINAKGKAYEGCLATTNMVAKKGRAKFLANNSLNHQDAGATTMFLIIQAISDSVNKVTEG